MGAGILIGNVTGFLRVAVTAYLLGTHAKADALAVAIGPVDMLNSAIINTMLVAFVPLLMAHRAENRAAVFARALRIFVPILASFSVLLVALAPKAVSLLGPGLAPAEHQQAVSLLRVFAPAMFFAGTSATFAALLYTERRFLIPALYQACVNGGMIMGAVVLWRFIGVNGFAIGYGAGAVAQLVLTWIATRDLRQGQTGTSLAARAILTRPAMYLLFATLLSANILVTRAFATHAGPGMAAALDYCLRCISVVVAYLVYPVANSLLPEIGRLRNANDSARAYHLIDRSVGWMAAASIAACVMALLLRKPLIVLLFEHGRFTAESTAMVSAVFLGFVPGIAGWALLDLICRCSFALDRPGLSVLCAFIPVLVNLLVTLLIPVTANTLALGASAGMIAGFAVLFGLTRFRGRNLAGNTVDNSDVVVRVH